MSDTPFITKDPVGLEFLEHLKPYQCYGGLDLSAVKDLTSFVLAWQLGDKVYTYPWFFLPSEGLYDRSKVDGVTYTDWLDKGYLEVCNGSTIDGRYIVSRIKELSTVFKIKEIGFDAWGARDIVTQLSEAGLTCVDIGQGIGPMTAPAKRLEQLVLDQKLVHTGHPILRWNCDCTTVWQDVNGNIKLQKPDSRKSSKRIDGMVALTMAVSRVQKAPPKFVSIYSKRGVLTL